MSATYNWAYRPGIYNKYALLIPNTADNIRPDGYCYVALFGNDISGNGSRLYPLRTIDKCVAVLGGTGTMIFGPGVYRETAFSTVCTAIILVGDGDVTWDLSDINTSFITNFNYITSWYNLKFIGNGLNSISSRPYVTDNNNFIDCQFINTVPFSDSGPYNPVPALIQKCIFNGFINSLQLRAVGSGISPFVYKNTNFFNLQYLLLMGTLTSAPDYIYQNCIFYKCNIVIGSAYLCTFIKNCLFYECNIAFSDPGKGGLVYPNTPVGYTFYSDINTLRSALSIMYSIPTPLPGCIIADPLFNNPSIGDYTLQFNSPAKNLSYFGTYVGAKSIAQAIKVSGTESTGGFDFSSVVNLTIADDSITLSNPALDGKIDTRVIVNLLGRELASLPSYGFNADRNGQYIDSIADLATNTQGAGATLLIPVPYLVETGVITYNGVVYQAGERFTTVTGQTTFTTTASGVVREILEAPQRHTVLARFSDGGAAVAAGSALTSGYWYFVQSGSVTYNGTAYTAEQVFKAIDTHAFSGSGSVITAMSTESYQHYELGSKPTSNNIGDSRTGAIIRGNGDPAYVRGGLGVQEFPITAKFIQVSYIIKVNNLKP
ncbi:MAG: hypothetical protein JWR38_5242 [Mucilaginibacter sp.]|nr:hypothetical protein [Mucilaginibacter sp.]